MDGNGNVGTQNINGGSFPISMVADGGFNVARAGDGTSTGPLTFQQAANKTIQLGSTLTGLDDRVLSVTTANGYGLDLTAALALSSTLTPTFNVGTASASNVVQSLTLSGALTGGVAGGTAFTKIGLGTLALTGGAGNTFGSGGSVLDIRDGVLSVPNVGSLGDADNVILLNPASGLTATFRATGNIALGEGTAPTIQFGGLDVASGRRIEVASGATLTLNSAIDTSLAPGAAFSKNEAGTLVLTQSQPGYTGVVTVNQGALRISNSTALGTASATSNTVVANVGGAALQLDTVSISEPLTLNNTGIGSMGALQAANGANTASGLITLASNASIGASASTTLNITGGITGAFAATFAGSGGITLSGTNALDATVTGITRLDTVDSQAGTLLINGANNSFVGTITMNHGVITVGPGPSGAGSIGGTGLITLRGGSTLAVTDTGGVINNRLNQGPGARGLTIQGGTFQYTANGGSASSETLGALSSAHGASTITLNNGGGSNATLTFLSMATVGGGSVLTFNSAQTLNATTNQIRFTTSPTLTNSIIPRAVVKDASGTNFATHTGNNTAITAFSAYETALDNSPNLGIGNVIDNYRILTNAAPTPSTTSTVTFGLSSDQAVSGLNLRTLNALKITGPGTDITFTATGGNQLALTTGNLLVTGGGTSSIGNTGAVMSFSTTIAGTTEGALLVDNGSTLDVNGTFANGVQNVTKGLGGNLNFNTKQYFNTGANVFTVLGGTVTLASGVTNTLWQGLQGSGTSGQSLSVGTGATLDLNGTAQMVGRLFTPSSTAFVGAGGTITSTGAATFVSVVGDASEWGGQITGNVFFNKAGDTALTIRNDNTYSGGTLITGNTLTLTDQGRLSGAGAIGINYGTLAITNAGTVDLADRVASSTITSKGGAISFTGRENTASAETLGDLVLDQGMTNLTATLGGGTVRSAVLTLGNITQNNNATVLLSTANGQMGSGGSRIFATNGASLLVNNIIPWMTGGSDFVSYVTPVSGDAAGGFAPVNSVGYAGYDGAAFPSTGVSTENYRLASASFVMPDVAGIGTGGTYNANAIAWAASANNQTLSFTDNLDTLNLTSGGLIFSGNFTGKTVGSAVGNGILTSGGAATGVNPLYLTVNQGAIGINSSIQNSGVVGASTRFVYMPFNGAVTTFNSANTYSGGTVLNGGIAHTGTLALNVAGANGSTTVAIPDGDLIVNAATVRLDQNNQIDFDVVPTLNGAGALNLNGFNQTLAGLNINNNGHSTAASVTTGAGTLTLSGTVTATSENAGSVATMTGNVDLGGARTFNVAPVTINGSTTVAQLTPTLNVTAVATNGSINKTGTGVLGLGGASTFGGGVTLSNGGIQFTGSTDVTTRDSLTGVANAFANGPLGTGAFTIAGGTFLSSDGTARTINNDYVLSGTDLTFRGLTNLTLNGATSLSGNTTITVEAPQMTAIMNGIIGEDALGYSITKNGLGTLVLGNNNTFTGGVFVDAGVLTLAGLNDANTSPVFGGTDATINSGGMLSLQNNGTGSNGLITYANNIVINSGLMAANLHVGNNGSNTGNTVAVSDLTLNGGRTLNVSSANGYILRLLNVSGDTVGGAVPQINPALGSTVVVFSYSGDKPINVGQGSLLFPDLVTIGTTTQLTPLGGSPGDPIVLSGTYPLGIQNAVLTGANMTSFWAKQWRLERSLRQLADRPHSGGRPADVRHRFLWVELRRRLDQWDRR